MEIACTICSRAKDESVALMPARLRYTGKHIRKVELLAEATHKPLYILSGKFGIINADAPIPPYDYRLDEQSVPSIAMLVAGQLRAARISQIDFYTEDKQTWRVYEEALHRGAHVVHVPVKTIVIR